MTWKSYRRLVQIAIILIFLIPLTGNLLVTGTLTSSKVLGVTLTDPLALLEVVLASKTVTSTLLISTLLIVLTYLVLGKAFCSWVCPVGLLVELPHELKAFISKSKTKKVTPKQYYWALPVVLLTSFMIGIPVFQAASPLGIFYRAFLFGLGLEVFILILIVALEMAGVKRGWCRLLCPLGAFYALLARLSPLQVQREPDKCIGCLKCVDSCDYTAGNLRVMVSNPLESSGSALCTRCGRCIDVCPARALKFTWKPPALLASRVNETAAAAQSISASRRYFLQAGGALALTGVLAASANVVKKTIPAVLRPPGAREEAEFLAKCIRCGKCIEICPDKTLLSAHADQGLGLGTPYFIPRETPCSLCMECPDVCPTEALTPLEMREVKIGIAVIDEERCYAYRDDVCRSCWNNCPLIDEALYMKDFQYPVVVEDKCTGCGICEYACVMDEPAIKIKTLGGF